MITNGEHPGVPQRPPASAHLVVSSTDRYAKFEDRWDAPTTSANWRMNKQYNLLTGYFTRLALTQLQVQWNMPTIATDRNDRLHIIIDVSPPIFPPVPPVFDKVIQIPQGSYTGAQLATAIQTAVTTAAGYPGAANFTCTYAAGTNTFTLAVGAGYIFDLVNPQISPYNQIIYRFYYTIGGGYTWDNAIAVSSYTTDSAPLYYTRWIDICSDALTQYQRVKDATTLQQAFNNNVIARVYPVAPNTRISGEYSAFQGPFVMCIDYNTPKHIRWDVNQAINNFDIQVFDEFGQQMAWDETNDTEYQLTFLASET